jgi:hypothetical protein
MKHEFQSTIIAKIVYDGAKYPSFSQYPITGYCADENGNPVADRQEFDAFLVCTLMPEQGKMVGDIFHSYAGNRTVLLVPKGQYAVLLKSIPVYYTVDDSDDGEQEDVDGIQTLKEVEELPEEYYTELTNSIDTGYPQPTTPF